MCDRDRDETFGASRTRRGPALLEGIGQQLDPDARQPVGLTRGISSSTSELIHSICSELG
jgi:hypothetical protein